MNKADERWWLESFLESRPEIRFDRISDHESPDFLCTIGGDRIGIEVVRYFAPSDRPHPPQAIESFHCKLSDDLVDRSLKARLPLGHYSVFSTRDDFGSSSLERNEIANDLIDFALKFGHPSERTEFDYNSLSECLQDAGFDQIMFFPNPSLSRPYWTFPIAHFVPRTAIGDMQNLIDKKMKKLSQYRKSASVNWLLVLSGAAGVGSFLNAGEQLFSTSYSFEFDRVFVFESGGRNAYELKKAKDYAIQPPPSCYTL